MKQQTHLEFIMSEQIRLQKEANLLSKKAGILDFFFKTWRYKRLLKVEMELIQIENQIDAVVGLCYKGNLFLKYAFGDLITPKVKKP